MKSLILIEDKVQLDVFFNKYKDKYLPVVYDIGCQLLLERNKEKFISINSELDYDEVLGIYHKASDFGEKLITKLDTINEENFYKLFGVRNLEFFRIATKYLFTYTFLSNLFHAMVGLDKILKKHNPCVIHYFAFDIESEIFSSIKSTDYFCPKRILPFFIPVFNGQDIRCIELDDKTTNRKVGFSSNFKLKIKRFACQVIFNKKLLNPNDLPNDRNVLVLTSAYQLRPAIENLHFLNKLLKNLCDDDFYIVNKTGGRITLKLSGSLRLLEKKINHRVHKDIKLDFQNGNLLKHSPFEFNDIPGINLESAISILDKILIIIEKYISINLNTAIDIWGCMNKFDVVYNFESLVWDNPPIIDVRKGIISEFFRIKRKPRIGIQHGGGLGYKYQDDSHFDCEYKHCEYYFGYGYLSENLMKLFPKREVKTKVLSKKACDADFFLRKYHCRMKKIKVLYVFPYNFGDPFFRLSRPNRIDEFLFDFQKKIINRLARYNTKEIMLKFPPGNFHDHAIKIYIGGLKHSFITISEPFSKVLEDYSAEYILIDVASTPLDQSLLYNSNLLVYDNPCAPLTDDAFTLLSKRAVVTKEQDIFLQHIDAIFSGFFPQKEIYNNEYMRKYARQPYFKNAESLNDFFILEDKK